MSETVKKLEAEGWLKRFTASGARLEEAIENYRALGFEVKTIPVRELECDNCTVCFDDETDASMMIFTREIGPALSDDEGETVDE